MVITINPALLNGPGYYNEEMEDKTVHFSNVYLHGAVESIFGYDICGIVKQNPNELEPGVYECVVLGEKEPCTLFLWQSRPKRNQGLIVLDSDVEEYDYAKKCYENKEISI